MCKVRLFGALVVLLVLLGAVPAAPAATHRTFVTGEVGGRDVIFDVTLDPAVAGSASIGIAVTDTIRLDGIDFLPGSVSEVAVGAQLPGGGSITHYNVLSGAVLAPLVPLTNLAPGAGETRPSTILPLGTDVYYTENQFGFAGAPHRILRTPAGGPAGTTELVFAADAAGLVNLEGMEAVDSRLYFFARDTADPAKRALYSIGLDGSGLWDTVAPAKHLGGLSTGPAGDGADELDYDPVTGKIYGSNIITGEIVEWDPVADAGGFLISEAEILAAPGGSDLKRLSTASLDGIRSTKDGYLVLTGLDGVILSVDLAGVAAGLGDEDVNILFDRALVPGNNYSFDDLTPVGLVPEPATLALSIAGILGLAGYVRRRERA